MLKRTTCNHFKDVFPRVSMSKCSKQKSDLPLRVCNLLDSGWQAGSLSGRGRDTAQGHRERLTDIHVLPPCLLSALFTLPDNGQVICPRSFLSHLRATTIVLSVWTGEISAGRLV